MNLKKYQNIIITSKKNPDIDGLACMVAYQKILEGRGIKATPVVFGKLQHEARYVSRKYEMNYTNECCHSERVPVERVEESLNSKIQRDFSTPSSILRAGYFRSSRNDISFDAIILVDTSMRSTLDPKINPLKVIQIIDHHKDAEIKVFPNAEIIYEPIGALATRFVEMLQKEKLPIDRKIAILLYAAILSNTVNLKNSVTTNRDHHAADYLEKTVKIPKEKFAHQMFAAKSNLIKKHLSQTIIDDSNYFFDSVLTSQLEIIDIEETVKKRYNEIKTTLEKLKKKYQAKMTFLNIVGLNECYNIIIVLENQTQRILEKILNIKFKNNIARTKKIIMRKEIMPKLREYLKK